MGGFFPRSTGKAGFLTRFDCWALEASKSRWMLYEAGPGPLAACTLSPNRLALENIFAPADS